jgi:hypothetical protein
MFSTWVGVLLLFAFFGLLTLVVLGASPRGTKYEKTRAKARAEKLKTLNEQNLRMGRQNQRHGPDPDQRRDEIDRGRAVAEKTCTSESDCDPGSAGSDRHRAHDGFARSIAFRGRDRNTEADCGERPQFRERQSTRGHQQSAAGAAGNSARTIDGSGRFSSFRTGEGGDLTFPKSFTIHARHSVADPGKNSMIFRSPIFSS